MIVSKSAPLNENIIFVKDFLQLVVEPNFQLKKSDTYTYFLERQENDFPATATTDIAITVEKMEKSLNSNIQYHFVPKSTQYWMDKYTTVTIAVFQEDLIFARTSTLHYNEKHLSEPSNHTDEGKPN